MEPYSDLQNHGQNEPALANATCRMGVARTRELYYPLAN